MPELQKKPVVDGVPVPVSPPDRSQGGTSSPSLVSRMKPSRTPQVPQLSAQLQPSGEQPALILPDGNFVTTSTLNSRTCRWPVGDPTELGFHTIAGSYRILPAHIAMRMTSRATNPCGVALVTGRCRASPQRCRCVLGQIGSISV